jgi:hypothetical protein
MSEEKETPKSPLVQFACGGDTLAARKGCLCYIKDEDDKEYEDCAGLKHPVSKERSGICWNPKAMFLASITFLKFWEDQFGDKENESKSETQTN